MLRMNVGEKVFGVEFIYETEMKVDGITEKERRVVTCKVYKVDDVSMKDKELRDAKGALIGVGVSKCHYKDAFNRRKGRVMAFQRAVATAIKAGSILEEDSAAIWENYYSEVSDLHPARNARRGFIDFLKYLINTGDVDLCEFEDLSEEEYQKKFDNILMGYYQFVAMNNKCVKNKR